MKKKSTQILCCDSQTIFRIDDSSQVSQPTLKSWLVDTCKQSSRFGIFGQGWPPRELEPGASKASSNFSWKSLKLSQTTFSPIVCVCLTVYPLTMNTQLSQINSWHDWLVGVSYELTICDLWDTRHPSAHSHRDPFLIKMFNTHLTSSKVLVLDFSSLFFLFDWFLELPPSCFPQPTVGDQNRAVFNFPFHYCLNRCQKRGALVFLYLAPPLFASVGPNIAWPACFFNPLQTPTPPGATILIQSNFQLQPRENWKTSGTTWKGHFPQLR